MAKLIYEQTFVITSMENVNDQQVSLTLSSPDRRIHPDIVMYMWREQFKKMLPLMDQEVKVSFTLLPESSCED